MSEGYGWVKWVAVVILIIIGVLIFNQIMCNTSECLFQMPSGGGAGGGWGGADGGRKSTGSGTDFGAAGIGVVIIVIVILLIGLVGYLGVYKGRKPLGKKIVDTGSAGQNGQHPQPYPYPYPGPHSPSPQPVSQHEISAVSSVGVYPLFAIYQKLLERYRRREYKS